MAGCVRGTDSNIRFLASPALSHHRIIRVGRDGIADALGGSDPADDSVMSLSYLDSTPSKFLASHSSAVGRLAWLAAWLRIGKRFIENRHIDK